MQSAYRRIVIKIGTKLIIDNSTIEEVTPERENPVDAVQGE